MVTRARGIPLYGAVFPPQEEPDPATRQARVQRIEALKITFISQRLNLSKRRRIRTILGPYISNTRRNYMGPIANTYNDEITRDEAVLNVRKKYQEQFSPRSSDGIRSKLCLPIRKGL